jgi:predicted TIM-barrel fold metal-dependent hydrolase
VLVDAQIHLFDPGVAAQRAEQLKQQVLGADEVLSLMDGAGVERAYLVPVGSRSNQTCLDVAHKHPERFRVMGIPGLDKAESREAIPQWKSLGYHGARLAFPPYRDVSWLRDGTADWFWPAAEDVRIPVMIWAPDHWGEISDIATAHPQLRIVLDHLNLPVGARGAEGIDRVVEKLLPLAAVPNIAVKASGLPARSSEKYPFRDIHASLREVIKAFGARRVFWGSDLTHLQCSLTDAVHMFTEELDFLDQAALDLIMGLAICDWIGW